MREYYDLIKAYELRRVDYDFYVHWMAYNNQRVKAMKGKGRTRKPVFTTFKKFFDYDSAVSRVIGNKGSRLNALKEHLKEKNRNG